MVSRIIASGPDGWNVGVAAAGGPEVAGNDTLGLGAGLSDPNEGLGASDALTAADGVLDSPAAVGLATTTVVGLTTGGDPAAQPPQMIESAAATTHTR
jgi:hypothetical protein